MGRFDGRVAMITGAARGMGASHARRLAREGADIVILDALTTFASVDYPLPDEADLESVARDIKDLGRRVIAAKVDIRDQGQLDALVSRVLGEFGQLDVLVANAGIYTLAPFWQMGEQTWQEVIDINLTGTWHTIKAVTPHMIERRSGSIVVISSNAAFEIGENYAHYAASKWGVLGLAKNVAFELAKYNIRCNAICPGFIQTAISDWQGGWDMVAGHPGGTHEDLVENAKHYPLLAGRSMLPPESVSGAVAFLASDDAIDVTGIALPVDAGHLLIPGYNATPVPHPHLGDASRG